jgi:prepilin-type N-terminal cleavage/methylation domain-containing protein
LTKNTKMAGFSLMEIMVTVALLGALALAVINQVKLANDTKKSSSESTIIRGLTDRLAVELNKQEVCTKNFKNVDTTATKTFNANETILGADGTVLITNGETYGKKQNGVSKSASDASTVKVQGIVLTPNPDDLEQMILKITFTKKTGALSVFSLPQKVNLPITVIKNGNLIDYCYNDITSSIQSAIRLSCSGNSDIYVNDPADPATNPPYGACFHNVDDSGCGTNKFIQSLTFDGSAGKDSKLKFGCSGLKTQCPAGQVIKGFNVDGSPNCDFPLPNCAAGQIMIKSSGGPYICLPTNSGCSGLTAIKSFNADGTVTCAQFYPQKSCAGLVTSISPSSIACSSNVKPTTCANGEFVAAFDSAGTAICKRFVQYPDSCGVEADGTLRGITGLGPDGKITCQKLLRKTSCNGVLSATNTYDTCKAAGGVILNPGTSNAFCYFSTTSTCPSGWSQCKNYAARNSASCTDENSACTHSTMFTKTAPAMIFGDPVVSETVTCDKWNRDPGPWVMTCTHVIGGGPSATTAMTEIGCF